MIRPHTCCFSFALFSALHADVLPGAWDSFTNEGPAKEWGVWDSAHPNDTWLPTWRQSIYSPVDHPEVISWAAPGNSKIWFIVDHAVGNGEFVGNYAAAGIKTIEATVSLVGPVEGVDVSILAPNGPAGSLNYFSRINLTANQPTQGMVKISVPLDDDWAFKADNRWHVFRPGEAFWSNVEQLGFRFHARSDATESYAELDNVRLVPTLEAPSVKPRIAKGEFTFSFLGQEGRRYQLQRLVGHSWNNEALPIFSGAGNHLYSEQIALTSLYRIEVKPLFMDVSFLPR